MKIDNGTGGSRETSTGKPERVGERGREPINFFAELKRRNVYKVAVAYAVVAWLLIQVATQVFPFFELPNWAVQVVVLAMVIGFPIAVVCSWAFEMTPEGIKLERDIDRRVTRKTGRKLTALITVVAALAAGVTTFRFLHSEGGNTERQPSVATEIESKSIAVLPFENLSEEKANAYFADGIQDEILTRLAKIADLKVISRTSTQHYKSTPENLREIAQQLGVAHILEGSVQKSGDAVRVNVQLIKAATDSHLWADSFDRKLTDIFAAESEIAKAIADQLRVHLTGREEQVIAAKPTDNPEAYDAYLRGLAYTLKTQNTPANYLGAQKYLREAVRLDPKFALAWALLAYVDARGYHTTNIQPTVALRDEARQAMETALGLDPGLGEAWIAKGYYQYGCVGDFEGARRSYEQARELLPNSSLVRLSLALLARDQGQWERAESYSEEAERLDPRNLNLLTRHAQFYITLRDFPEALRKLDQILEIVPDDIDALVEKGAIAQAQGDLPRAASILTPLRPAAGDPTGWEQVSYQAILERRPAEIILRLKELLTSPDPNVGYLNGELRFWLGWAQEVAGDNEAARETWRQARAELEALVKDQPENWALLDDLALITASLGNKAAALALVDRAMALNPIEKEAANGMQTLEILARVATRVGEPDRAITVLEGILSRPGNGGLATGMPLTPALLQLDPMFDSLRNDPRFQKLANSSGPK